jgi:hypothetical protein
VVVDLPVEGTVIAQEKLDSNLVRGVRNLIRHREYLKYPEIPMEKSFFVMVFMAGPRSNIEVNTLDSVVTIFLFDYFFAPDNELLNYRGMLNVDGYNVAIFESKSDDFGSNFFNIDSLQQVPLDGFKRFPIKNTISEEFRVHNEKLKYLGEWLSVADPATLRQ